MRVARAIHRAILRLAPRSFRAQYADEADQAFARLVGERRRRSGALAAGALVLGACLDALSTVIRERRRAFETPSLAGAGPELRGALRLIRRRPSYAATVIVTIGLSAGVLAAVFAFVDPLLWRPLPLPEADRVVIAHAEGERVVMNQPQKADYFRLLEPTASFESVAAHYSGGWGHIDGMARQMNVAAVGVLPPGFLMPNTDTSDLAGIVPGDVRRSNIADWRARTPIVGRLRHGVSREAAEQELRQVAAETERAYPSLPQQRTMTLVTLREEWFGEVRTIALLLFAGAAAVVLVAGLNLAQLIKSRLRAREHELAVRTAIGAGIMLAAVVAAWVPARRAASIDPAITLKAE